MPNRSSRLIGRILDAVIPGDAYNSTTGRWNPATLKVGLMSMGVGQVVPGGGYLVQKGAERGWFGQSLSQQLLKEYVGNQISKQPRATVAPTIDVPNAAGRTRPSMSMMTPPPTDAFGYPNPNTKTGTSGGKNYSKSGPVNVLGHSGPPSYTSPQSRAAQWNGATVLTGDAARTFMEASQTQPTMQTGADALGRKYAQ